MADYLYVTDSFGTSAQWHRAPSDKSWALCGKPFKKERWRSVANEIEGMRKCRSCKHIARTLNQMGVNRA